MKFSIKTRLAVDAAMLALMLLALAFRITGSLAHEFIGLSASALFIFHNAANLAWYKGIGSGKYSLKRSVNAAINIMTFACAAILVFSGLMGSRHILAFLELPGSIVLRQIHMGAAYWSMLLVSMHLGMHWDAVMRHIKINYGKRKILARLILIPAFVFGVWAFIKRDIFQKLFLGYSFDFWDPESPTILFFLYNIAIIVLMASPIYYLSKFLSAAPKAEKNISYPTTPNI